MIGAAPRKRVYTHGDFVTVCIAGICRESRNGEQTLVLCTDTRVTISGFASSDTATKLESYGPLVILFADNGARAKELVAVIKDHVKKEELADDSIVGRLKEAAKIHKKNLLNEYFGLAWGIDYNSYLIGTLNHLPGEVLSKIAREAEQLNFECQLIITARAPRRGSDFSRWIRMEFY
jgi:hypothetical protein